MIPPEEMTLELAIAELRSMAESLEIDVPSDAGYVEQLQVIIDFLVLFGDALKEGMNGLIESLSPKTN